MTPQETTLENIEREYQRRKEEIEYEARNKLAVLKWERDHAMDQAAWELKKRNAEKGN